MVGSEEMAVATLIEVREAAFWSQWICLDCGGTEDCAESPLDEALEITGICSDCGGTLRKAAVVLEILGKVEGEET